MGTAEITDFHRRLPKAFGNDSEARMGAGDVNRSSKVLTCLQTQPRLKKVGNEVA